MLIALDINSNRTGFAFGGASDGSPRVSVWHMPGGDDLPRVCAGLYNSISELSKVIHPNYLIVEAPLQMTERSSHTSLVLISLFGVAQAAGHNAGARVVPAHVGTWRKHFIGAGNLKGTEAKRLTLERCRVLGWRAENHDEGDACGVWCWGMSKFYPRWAPSGTPLFAQGRAA